MEAAIETSVEQKASETPPAKPVKPTKPVVTTAAGGAVAPAEATGTDPEEGTTVFQFSEAASKNVSDILAKDAEDESLRKYKEQLLGAAAHGDLGDLSDPRRLIVTEFMIVFADEEGQAPILHDLSSSEGLQRLSSVGITMKEGAKFKFRISFKVQHEILAGVKFINKVSKMMMSETESLMIGSYPPASTPHIFEFPKFDWQEAPKGMLFRGEYKVKNSFVDSDGIKHLEFGYALKIKSGW